MIRRIACVVIVGASLGGCNAKQPPPSPGASASPTPVPVRAPIAAAVAPAASSDIPVVEDFEKKALEEVDPQNLDAMMTKLEADIGS